MKLSTRIAAGTLAAVLPLAAAVGCGVEKKRTIKGELAAAQDNLARSEALSVRMHFDDDNGNLRKVLLADDEGVDDVGALTDAVLRGGISYTIDPAGNRRLRDLQTQGQSEKQLEGSIKDVNLALAISSDHGPIGELRLVAGTLYAHVDLTELDRLAAAAGEDPVTGGLDDFAKENPELKQGVADVRAGKWLRLPLTEYLDQLKGIADSLQGEIEGDAGTQPEPSASSLPDVERVGQRVIDAVKPYVEVTDANDDSAHRVLDVNVQVRPALKAVLAALKSSGEPFSGALEDVDPSEVDENVANGTAHGTITLADGHLEQVTIDMESIRLLDPEAGTTSLKGSTVVVDVDDDARRVVAPSQVSAFDLGKVFESFFSAGQEEDA